LVSSDWVSDRRHSAIEPKRPSRPSSVQRERGETDDRLPTAFSLMLVFVSSLGLWAAIWTLVALLA
jgi:hypothetical protein